MVVIVLSAIWHDCTHTEQDTAAYMQSRGGSALHKGGAGIRADNRFGFCVCVFHSFGASLVQRGPDDNKMEGEKHVDWTAGLSDDWEWFHDTYLTGFL